MESATMRRFGRLQGRRGSAVRLGVEGLEQRRALALFTSGPFGWAAGFEAGPWTLDPANISNWYRIKDTAVDATGNVYVTGAFSAAIDFDPSNAPNALSTMSPGSTSSAFIAKFSSGGRLTWVQAIAGAEATALAVTGTGNVIVAGSFDGMVDFDPAFMTDRWLSSSSVSDGFVLCLTPSGAHAWSRSLGTGSLGVGMGVSDVLVDGSNAIYLAGADFRSDGQNAAGFLRKLDGWGNDVWTRSFGDGISWTRCSTVGLDADGGVSVFGACGSQVDLDPGPGIWLSQGMAATFVVRLTAAGVYSRSFSVPTVTDILNWGDFLIDDVAFATDGSIYAGGRFYGMRDLEYLLGGSAQGVVLKSAGRFDGFVMKLTPFGGLEWARSYGSTGDDGVTRVAINSAGTVFAGGEFAGRVDFDSGPGVTAITPTGTRDAFLLRLNAGGGLSAVRSYGGVATSTLLFQLTVGANGTVIWTGLAAGRSLNLSPGGAAAVLQRPLLNAARPWIGEFFAKETFTAGAFTPAGMVIAGVELGSTSLGYALRSAGRVVQVTFSGGFASASRPGSGWTAVAARPVGSGYELLWRNGQTGGWSIWSLDASGVRTGERAAGLAAIWALETRHGVDITRDGRIGAPAPAFTPQRKLGITEFGTTAAGYALRVNSRVVQITHGGVNASAASPGNGWVARAARRVDTGFEVLWRNTSVGGWSAWTLDASGAKTGERSLRLVDVYALERNFNTDITGDGTVGAPGGTGGGGGGTTTGEWWQTWWQGTWEGSVDDPGNGKDRAAMRYNLRLTLKLLDDPDGKLTGKPGWGVIGAVLSINDDHRTWNVADKFMLDFARPGVEPGLPSDVSALGGMVQIDYPNNDFPSWPPAGSYKNVYYPVVQIMKSQAGPVSGAIYFSFWPLGTPLGDGAAVAWKKVP